MRSSHQRNDKDKRSLHRKLRIFLFDGHVS
jgi:hypothetical protein